MKNIFRLTLCFILIYSANLFAQEKVSYYHTDAAGTVLAITDQTGNKVWEVDYKPFGEESAFLVQQDNNRRFLGKEKDILGRNGVTGLNYLGARYLSAEFGRFLSVDPVRAVDYQTGGIHKNILENPQRANVYTYSLNNPYRYVDPDGNAPVISADDSRDRINAFPGGFSGAGRIGTGNLDGRASRLPGMASTEVLAEESSIAAKGGSRLLNSPIKITQEGMQHVIERHTYNDIAKYSAKSKFNQGENIVKLIEYGTQQPISQQINGRLARTYDLGKNIGINRATGQQTSIMTVITENNGNLVTAFPGNP